MQKISQKQAKQIVQVLQNVVTDEFSLDKSLNILFKTQHLTQNTERKLIVFACTDIIRNWLLLKTLSSTTKNEVVNFWHILAVWAVLQEMETSAFEKLNKNDINAIYTQFEKLQSDLSLKYSFPEWLSSIGAEAYGTGWEKEMEALRTEAPVVLRVNTLKTSLQQLKTWLENENIKVYLQAGVENALVLKVWKNVFSLDAYKNGWFEVQESGSQLISEYLEAEPGMRVIDACAGNGGKSLHLAALMQNKGKIIALDTQLLKLEVLTGRATRAGVSIIETRVIEGSKTIKRLEESADRLLLDVPCSGTGAIRRNPEIAIQLTPEKLNNLLILQADILQRYSQMLKPGGLLVYSTCSILPSENQLQVESFISKNASYFELIKQNTILPSQTGFDGFYMAQIRRK